MEKKLPKIVDNLPKVAYHHNKRDKKSHKGGAMKILTRKKVMSEIVVTAQSDLPYVKEFFIYRGGDIGVPSLDEYVDFLYMSVKNFIGFTKELYSFDYNLTQYIQNLYEGKEDKKKAQ